jgi:RimJ/RimL family protein N-acetyltransferase
MNLFDQNIVLENAVVRLSPMSLEDSEDFCQIAFTEAIWKYTNPGIANQQQMEQYLQDSLAGKAQQLRYPFTIVEKHTGTVAGTTSFLNFSAKDARLEIGYTWLGSHFQGTQVNQASKHLLLAYAFETLGMERVEFKTDFLNQKSRKALLKLGATEEGVLRSHMLMHDGRRRDSIYYSILKPEWERVQATHFPAFAHTSSINSSSV